MGQEDQVGPYDEDAALEAFCRGGYEEVLRTAVPHAGMFSLHYQCGYGAEQDANAAESWLIRAAEQENVVAWNTREHCIVWACPAYLAILRRRSNVTCVPKNSDLIAYSRTRRQWIL